MFNFHKKADAQLQLDVETELSWDPKVSAKDISVTAEKGIVTLSGTIPHYVEKSRAAEAAQRVVGVRGVENELEVKIFEDFKRTDDEIRQAAVHAIQWDYEVSDGVDVSVDEGWVTLCGEVEWEYEKNAAEDAVSSLIGVRGISNNIRLKSKVQALDVKTLIEAALKRTAESEGQNINVTVSGSHVSLSGNVHSLTEVRDARNAAWSAPGVTEVDDDLIIIAA